MWKGNSLLAIRAKLQRARAHAPRRARAASAAVAGEARDLLGAPRGRATGPGPRAWPRSEVGGIVRGGRARRRRGGDTAAAAAEECRGARSGGLVPLGGAAAERGARMVGSPRLRERKAAWACWPQAASRRRRARTPRTPGALRRRLLRPSTPGCGAPQASALSDLPLRCAAGFYGARALAASRRTLPRPSDPGCVAPQAAPPLEPRLRCAAGSCAHRPPAAYPALRRRLLRRASPGRLAPQAAAALPPSALRSVRARAELRRGRHPPRQGPTRGGARTSGLGGRCASAARPARPRERDRGSPRTRGQTERAAGRTLACALRPR